MLLEGLFRVVNNNFIIRFTLKDSRFICQLFDIDDDPKNYKPDV